MLISFLPIQYSQPNFDSAEISLFGPGIGECIVIHIGEGEWFIIDSCLCPDTKQPIALKYLTSIGVDVSTQVIGILITHWHSDHIIGAFELLKSCEQAKFYASLAFFNDEAFNLSGLYKKDVFSNTDKEIREFGEIVQFLFKKNDQSRFDTVKAKHTFFDLKNKIQTKMVALSPSNTAVTQAIVGLKSTRPQVNSERLRKVLPTSENLNAVAINFTFGDFSAILGSDLEESTNGNSLTGWSAVFSNNLIKELGVPASSIFKVPHHGSDNGHHDKIWSELLVDKPLSITTSFSRSNLPTISNINRIKNLSSEFLVTRDPNAAKKTKRNNMVEKELKAIVKSIKSVNDKMGHIQVRISSDGDYDIALNDNCVKYSN